MLEKLLSYLRSGLDNDPFVRLESIAFRHPDAAELLLNVMDYHGSKKLREWKILARGVVDYRIEDAGGDLQFYEDHVLARQHTEQRQDLYFRGVPSSAPEAVGRLLVSHLAATGGWIPFDRYLNSCCPIEDLLKNGSGKLADGPRFLIDAYSLALGTLGLRMTALAPRPPKFWNGQAWIESTNRLATLIIGDSFMVAEGFEEHQKVNDHAAPR